MDEVNPYAAASIGSAQIAGAGSHTLITPKRLFVYSYCVSAITAFVVVLIWLFVVFNDSSIPQSQRRTSLPGVFEWIFFLASTLPSVLTCQLFSFFYYAVYKVPEKLRLWPAIVFGGISGTMFNAMTAVWLIENLFDW